MASKWLPGYTYDAASGRYRRADTGRFVKRDTITDLLETSISQRARDVRRGFEAVLNEELGITPWLHRMAQELKREHLELAALAAGGWDRLTPADYARIDGRLNFDFKHLAVMAREIADEKVSLAQGLNRLDMYLGSARREYLDIERNGRLARVKDGYALIAKRFLGYAEHCQDCQDMAMWPWRPADVVPIPGEGTRCLTNCRCTIEYKETPLAYMEAVASEFNPNHGPDGRFTSGPSSGAYVAATIKKATGAMRVTGSAPDNLRGAAAEYLEGSDAWALKGLRSVTVDAEPGITFALGGQQVAEAGSWVEGAILMRGADNRMAKGDFLDLFAHEVGHNAFHVAQSEPEGEPGEAAYRSFMAAYRVKGGDGITEYSEAWSKRGVAAETFAEMFRIETREGSMALEDTMLNGSPARQRMYDAYFEIRDTMSQKYGGQQGGLD